MSVPSQQTTVGRLVPVEATLDEKLAGLVDSNVVAWSRQKLGPVHPPARALRGRMVADLLLEDRE